MVIIELTPEQATLLLDLIISHISRRDGILRAVIQALSEQLALASST